VTRLLVSGDLPPSVPTLCRGDIADPYLPLPPASVRAARDPLAYATAVDDWINTLPAYEYWAGGAVRAGCDHGGSVGFTDRHASTVLSMTACALTPGLPMTASGTVDVDGAMRLSMRTSLGELRYVRDADGVRYLTGTWRGATVDERG